MRPTAEQIRQAGLAALRRELGKAGMIRFMLQFSRGYGDYAKERRAWVDRTSLDDIVRQIEAQRKRAGRKRQAAQDSKSRPQASRRSAHRSTPRLAAARS